MASFSVKGILSLDGTPFQAAMARSEASLKRFAGSAINSIGSRLAGLFALGAIEEGARRVMAYADELIVLSTRLGVTVDWLQEMGYVARHTGTDLETLARVTELLGASRMAALAGTASSEGKLEAFGKLGVGVEALKNSTAMDIYRSISDTFKKFGRSDELVTAFKQIGGRGAGLLVAALVNGIDEGREEARKSGAMMSSETIYRLKELEDRMAIFALRLSSVLGDAIIYAMGKLNELRGIVGAAAAYAGARTYNVTWKEAAAGVLTGGHMTAAGQSFWTKVLSEQNAKAAEDAFRDAVRQWVKENEADQRELAARIANMMSAGGPPPGGYEYRQYKGKEPSDKTGALKPLQSDALVAVGNFLGSNRSILSNLQEQVSYLAKIERNTRPSSAQDPFAGIENG